MVVYVYVVYVVYVTLFPSISTSQILSEHPRKMKMLKNESSSTNGPVTNFRVKTIPKKDKSTPTRCHNVHVTCLRIKKVPKNDNSLPTHGDNGHVTTCNKRETSLFHTKSRHIRRFHTKSRHFRSFYNESRHLRPFQNKSRLFKPFLDKPNSRRLRLLHGITKSHQFRLLLYKAKSRRLRPLFANNVSACGTPTRTNVQPFQDLLCHSASGNCSESYKGFHPFHIMKSVA